MTAGVAPGLVSGWLNTQRSTGNGGAAYNAVAGTFVQLHTADPGAAGTTAVSVGDTSRKEIEFAASSAGSALALDAEPSPWTNGGATETITHLSVWTAASGGTFQYSVALTVARDWAEDDEFTLKTLTMAITPQAS
ncbi:phage tail fiber protein [Streptomyces chartreusis]|uniref:phage tail fiber protein n=1 Tax=Streptomyces chartreusis TaxID=1969 RepID=UPI003808F489